MERVSCSSQGIYAKKPKRREESMNPDLIEEIIGRTSEEIRRLPKCHIMLIGKTGVGKSTLINTIFRENIATTGIGKPVTRHLERIEREDIPLILYDTKGYELTEHSFEEINKELVDTISRSFLNGEDKIHLVYYCIHALAGRIEQREIDIINNLGKLLPVIVVLTQAVGDNAKKLEEYILGLNLNVRGVVPVLAKDYPVTDKVTVPAYGLKKLLELSFESLPENLYDSFNNAQQIDIEKKTQRARRWAKRYIATSFGVGFTPIPFSDASVLVPMQIGMLAHITAIFGVNVDKARIASIIAAVGGTSGATVLGKSVVANVMKLVPGVGTLVGGLISGATASVITTALAMSYIEALAYLAKTDRNGKNVDLSHLETLMKEGFKRYLKRKERSEDEK